MTTAARPTFDPAKGGGGRGEKDLSAITRQYSSRDLPAHTKLKYRESGQGTVDEHKNKDYRRELEDRERTVRREKDKESSKSRPEPSESQKAIQPPPSKKSRVDPANLDADDPLDDSDVEGDGDDTSDDEDDTAALMAELQRIKKERAADQARKEAEKRAEEERIRAENILSGNPLLNNAGPSSVKADLKVKRRWDEDVVFKNCARAESSDKNKGFINDCLRSDFHRKFMEKYIK
ncbi:unnamed protein product [Allacma fusca]|uniref:Uncharacterized protein n=1 Tax=Allacma fusca TaxID=39272 RepID=A0A8J2JUP9_9HEXA|nr:unnamed protein product [Allacma fusca]